MIFGPFLVHGQLVAFSLEQSHFRPCALREAEARRAVANLEMFCCLQKDRIGARFMRGLVHEIDRGLPGVVE